MKKYPKKRSLKSSVDTQFENPI